MRKWPSSTTNPTPATKRIEWWLFERTSLKSRAMFGSLTIFATCFTSANDLPAVSSEDIVFGCNDRCDQENLIAQLCGGVRSLCAPVDNLASNWAYMVITSIAWNLKSWSALLTPVAPGQEQEHRAEKKRLLTMEFRTFLSVFIHVPCQILRHARKTIHRFLNWTDYTPAFFRLCAVLNL